PLLRVPRLGERVVGARAPKRLAAITRLARVPGPVRVPEASARVARSARGPARVVSVARDVAPTSPVEPAFTVHADDLRPAESVLPGASPAPEVQPSPGAPRLLRAPSEPPPPDLPDDMRFLWDVWQREKPGGRGVLERGRGARIEEGSAPQGEP